MNSRRLLLSLSVMMMVLGCTREPIKPQKPAEDHFFSRFYPDMQDGASGYYQSMAEGRFSALRSSQPSWNQPWVLEGPANTGGRINCLAVRPGSQDSILAGSASGGIFKTDDGGDSWYPVFDGHPHLAISAIAYDPANPSIVYAGTGDKNISITPFIGNGLYKSTDGGNNWFHTGLSHATIISKIVIDPVNTDNIYIAAMGIPFAKNNDRGVYKSIDGGATWTQSLFVNDSTGAIDLLINPDNPQILYAATWNRLRTNSKSLVSGPDAGIYKSADGGITWNKLTNGLPAIEMSRIGLAMSGSHPDHLWAVFVDANLEMHGIFKSTDGGNNWVQTGDPGPVMGGFGWYFGRIEVNPANDNELFVCGVELWKTADGGNNWSAVSQSAHVDNHDLAYLAPDTWLLATDGGIYKTTDGAASWIDIDLIPNNQFYRITWNPHVSGEYAGGVQDNGTNTGSASTLNSWQQIFGGDGFQMRYHPADPLTHYIEIQNGELFVTTDGFSYMSATTGIDFTDRRGWDMPYILNPDFPDELYTGTYRVYANYTGSNVFWIPISPDLTDGVIFGERFHTISAIAQSRMDNNRLMAGTSDGNVWKSDDAGGNWLNITNNLPDRYVTAVHYSTSSANTAYVTHSGYKDNDFIPHVHRTTDNGNTWIDISGNLPQIAVNDLVTLEGNDSILFVATDAGVYGSTDNAASWHPVGTGMPAVAVFDIETDAVNNKLLAGTFGRSMWSYPLDSIITSVSEEKTQRLNIYPNPAEDYIYIESGLRKYADPFLIYDNTGKHVRTVSSNSCNLKGLKPGTYFIKAGRDKGTHIAKFVKL